MAYALLSVDDKTGLEELADTLEALGLTLMAGGGTKEALGTTRRPIREYKPALLFEEVEGGRRRRAVDPGIFSAIGAHRDVESDMAWLKAILSRPIDWVVCNLRKPGLDGGDHGGHALLWTAAANWRHVVVLVDPGDYPSVIDELGSNGGQLSDYTRWNLALKTYEYTTLYSQSVLDLFREMGPPPH